MSFERALEHEARHRGHLLERMRERVAEREALEAISADRLAAQTEALVHREHEPGLFERVVQRVVGAVTEVAAVQMVRSRHHRDEAELRGAARLRGGALRIGERRDADAESRRGVVRAVRRDPVVVAPARVVALGRVELGLVRHEQPDRRVQDDGVDALRSIARRYDGGSKPWSH